MSNWWDAAPLAQPAPEQKWWEAAPLAQNDTPQTTPQDNRIEVRPSSTSQEVGPQMPDQGAVNAGARGIAQGVTANFYDELRGLMEAGGLDPKDPASLGSLLKGAALYWGGNDEAEKRYDAAANRERAVSQAAEDQHPVASIAGNVAGALTMPIGGMAGGATMGARAFRGAGIGAATGALAGAGEGEGAGDTAARAAGGLALGGILGGLATPVIEGVARGVGALASRPISYVRSARNPQAGAEQAIGRAAAEAQKADPSAANRLTGTDLIPGGQATAMDTLGAPGRDLARAAGNLSGEARDTLNATLQPRYEGQGGRVIDWMRSTFHYPDAHAQQEAIDTAAKAVNKPAYQKAYNAGDREINSPELERLSGSPTVVSAMGSAIRKWKDWQIVDGFGGMNPGFTIGNGGILTMNRGGTGVPAFPNIQLWDYTARNLQGLADKAFKAGDNTNAARYGGLAKQVKAELDKIVPEYQDARLGASKFFKAENALEAGQNFVNENFAIPGTRAALAKMSKNERQLFQDGFVSRYVESLEKIPDRADVVRRIYESPAARQKIDVALGPQRAKELEAILRVENIMQQSLRSVQGNSTTAQQLATMGLAGGGAFAAGGAAAGLDPQDASVAGIVGALTTAGKRGIDIRVARRVAEMLVSNDPAVMQRAMRTVANSPALMNAFRAADKGAAKLGGQNAPNGIIPALQAPAVSRADSGEPEVPRPPGQ